MIFLNVNPVEIERFKPQIPAALYAAFILQTRENNDGNKENCTIRSVFSNFTYSTVNVKIIHITTINKLDTSTCL